jgi:hypothetical protein
MTQGDWIFVAVYWYFCAKLIVWLFDEFNARPSEPKRKAGTGRRP